MSAKPKAPKASVPKAASPAKASKPRKAAAPVIPAVESIVESSPAVIPFEKHPDAEGRSYPCPDLKFNDFGYHGAVYGSSHDVDLPASCDLSGELPAAYDQLTLAAGSACAAATLFEFLLVKSTSGKGWSPSRLFIYRGQRFRQGVVDRDTGGTCAVALEFLNLKGGCPESLWPYKVDEFAAFPPEACWKSGYFNRILQPLDVGHNHNEAARKVLHSGTPVAIDLTIFAAFESKEVGETGVLPMPTVGEEPIGMQGLLLVGYDDTKRAFLARNSFGPSWGLRGNVWIPYDYVASRSNIASMTSARYQRAQP